MNKTIQSLTRTATNTFLAMMFLLMMAFPFATHAQVAKASCPPISASFKHGFTDPLGDVCIPELVNRLILGALSIVGIVFFLLFLWGGLQWMTAGGDSGQIKKATSTLTNAVIGLAIVALSYAIVTAVIKYVAAGLG